MRIFTISRVLGIIVGIFILYNGIDIIFYSPESSGKIIMFLLGIITIFIGLGCIGISLLQLIYGD